MLGHETAAGADVFVCNLDHLVAERGLSREEAYILSSVCVDLCISEIVDAPNWVVSAYLPKQIFRSV